MDEWVELEVQGRDHMLMAIGYLHAELSTELGEVAARLTPVELAEKFDKALKETREDEVLDPLELGARKAKRPAPTASIDFDEEVQAGAEENLDELEDIEVEEEPLPGGKLREKPAEIQEQEDEEGGMGKLDPGERAAREHRAEQIERGADSAFAREKSEREARRKAGGLASDETAEGLAEVEVGTEPDVSVEAQSGNVLKLVPCQHPGCGNQVPSSKGLINGQLLCTEHEPQPQGGGDGIEIEDL